MNCGSCGWGEKEHPMLKTSQFSGRVGCRVENPWRIFRPFDGGAADPNMKSRSHRPLTVPRLHKAQIVIPQSKTILVFYTKIVLLVILILS